MLTVRNPTRSRTVSASVETTRSYSTGDSADHGRAPSTSTVVTGTRGDPEFGQFDASRCRALDVDRQDADSAAVIPVGVDEEILDAAVGAVAQAHRAEDAREPPLVLVLEVAREAPLSDTHGQLVDSRPQRIGDVELARQAAARCIADRDAVDPHLVPGVDALESEHSPSVLRPVRGQLDVAAILAGRIHVRHVRRLHGEREDDVRVGRPAEPLQLPMPGHVDPAPGCPRVGRIRVIHAVRAPAETPSPIEAQHRGVASPAGIAARVPSGADGRSHALAA